MPPRRPALWLTVATLGSTPARLLATGNRPRSLRPLTAELRGPHRAAITSAVDRARTGGEPVIDRSGDGIVVAVPLVSPLGEVSGVQVIAAPSPEAVGSRPHAGAWDWDVGSGSLLISDDRLDMHGVPDGERRNRVSSPEALLGLPRTDAAFTATVAAALTAPDGTLLDGVRQMPGHDGVLRDIRFALLISADGSGGRWLHGVTADVTAGEAVPAPRTFAEASLRARRAAAADEYVLLMDLVRLNPLSWITEPLEKISHRATGVAETEPAIHPDDMAKVVRLRSNLLSGATVSAETDVRVRDVTGAWMAVRAAAIPAELAPGQGIVAAFVTLTSIDTGT